MHIYWQYENLTKTTPFSRVCLFFLLPLVVTFVKKTRGLSYKSQTTSCDINNPCVDLGPILLSIQEKALNNIQ